MSSTPTFIHLKGVDYISCYCECFSHLGLLRIIWANETHSTTRSSKHYTITL